MVRQECGLKNTPKQKSSYGVDTYGKVYFMYTLGNVSKSIVKEYIENQLTEYNAGRPRS